ncbi:MAG: hypothetical protein M1822_002557 [Bathelium mastoideum]|nr:MAG: hypothetical protein M1822_002557 [Bathelium mastoideum]
MSSTRIAELANLVQANTLKVDDWLQRHHLPSPSFDEDGPVDFKISSPEVQDARNAAIEASIELQDLLAGPSNLVRPILNGSALQAIYKFDIPAKVPLSGEVAFEELAKQCNVSEPDLKRLLRFAMSWHRVFQERNEGFVSHSAASKLLTQDHDALQGVGFMFDEVIQAFANTVQAMETMKGPEPNKTGWNAAHDTDLPMYQYHAKHPAMAKRFAGAMSTFTKGYGLSVDHIVNGFPWSSLGHGTVVDVGGASGHIAVAIAKATNDLQLVVQDLPEIINGAREPMSPVIAHRIRFMEHDFFKDQPVKADVYFFRQIFHNWSDEFCIKILRALIPALKAGSRILINDHVVPKAGTMSLLHDRAVRDMDLIVMSLFNAREREEQDWMRLFESADSRFQFVKAWRPEGATLSFIEARWPS